MQCHMTSTFNIYLGATLFLTPEYELTLDPDDSIALNPNEIPLVTFRKRITSKLGKPYGSCRIGFSIELNEPQQRTNHVNAVLLIRENP